MMPQTTMFDCEPVKSRTKGTLTAPQINRTHTECWKKCGTISGVGHGPYMFPTLKAQRVLDLCPFLWCRARTSYVFKSISLTKDSSSEQDTRGHRRRTDATSMHQRDKTHDVQACLDSPQHLQRSFLCCYALDEPVGCVPLSGPRLPPMHNTSFNFNC